MKVINENCAIIFDADVIIHFISGDRLLDLFSIFPNKCLILDKVYHELSRNVRTKETLDNQIKLGLISLVNFDGDYTILKEYATLINLRGWGQGESACLAYCKIKGEVIASSNLKDIKNYCKLHSIDYLTTADFMKKAYCDGNWNDEDLSQFITKLVEKAHKIPFNNLSSFKRFMKIG